jgi:hypothetical protein
MCRGPLTNLRKPGEFRIDITTISKFRTPDLVMEIQGLKKIARKLN